MDYIPRHSQPFTLEQAILLDVSIISEEITRLQNSLQHLKRTQDELRQHVASTSSPDADFIEATAENEDVIGSQEERVMILKLALAHKGVSMNSGHYDLIPQSSPSGPSATGAATRESQSTQAYDPPDGTEDEEGIHL